MSLRRGQVNRGIRITADPGERIPQGRADRSRDQAAEKVGVNPRYVSDAKKIKREARRRIRGARAGEGLMLTFKAIEMKSARV